MGKQDGSSRQESRAGVDDSTATILHADLDAFFASVELLERPDLRGLPVIVAHDGARSVVTAATYEARKFGVNSAMPLAIAKRRCPQAIILEPHFDRYQHYSRVVFSIFDDLTPKVERLGIDEAFLDVAGAGKVIGSPIEVATLLRQRVRAETGLVVSVGAASTKFVAKLASGRSKPDGLLVVPRDETVAFLHPLPISQLWGVGARTEESLKNRGLHTIGDLAAVPLEQLKRFVGEAGGAKLHDLSWGRDSRSVQPRADEKSIGHEETFATDVTDERVIRRELLRLSNMVAVRLREAGMSTRTIALKLRYSDFSTISRSKTIADPTSTGRRIFEEAMVLFHAQSRHDPIRLIGVRAEQLSAGGSSALWDVDETWTEAEGVMDAATQRFGRGAVTQASLLGRTGRRSIERDLQTELLRRPDASRDSGVD
jgi:DNA polymerase IV